jgi:ABC-type uncharacterized transport system involved in gliding motility auxiliary subunit
MDSGKALVDLSYSTRLRNERDQIEDNPLWLSLRKETFNGGNLITSELESMLLPVAGAIEKNPDSPYEYEALITSSTNSGLIDAFKARFGTAELRKDFKPTQRTYDVAVRVRGSFETAFPDGRPAGETAEEDAEKAPSSDDHRGKADSPSTIVVVADADCLFDGYYVNRQNFLGYELARIFNDNLNFLLNAGELLTGNDALISIRTRGTYERPFDRVEAIEASAEEKWLVREQELVEKVEETNRKLSALEQQKDASQGTILSKEQEEEIRKFQEEKFRINRELKEVRRNMRADIERLGAIIKFINIFLLPILVSLGGVIYAVYRRKRSVSGARNR